MPLFAIGITNAAEFVGYLPAATGDGEIEPAGTDAARKFSTGAEAWIEALRLIDDEPRRAEAKGCPRLSFALVKIADGNHWAAGMTPLATPAAVTVPN